MKLTTLKDRSINEYYPKMIFAIFLNYASLQKWHAEWLNMVHLKIVYFQWDLAWMDNILSWQPVIDY